MSRALIQALVSVLLYARVSNDCIVQFRKSVHIPVQLLSDYILCSYVYDTYKSEPPWVILSVKPGLQLSRLQRKKLQIKRARYVTHIVRQLPIRNVLPKVFVITGSTAGVGKELAQILYSRNTKVYVAARSTEKASTMIAHTQAKHPESEGELIFLYLDLADLNQVKNSANEFLSKEQRLDVLWNNAAVMAPPEGSVTKQGYELQLGTNALGPFLFTKLLTPLLCQTAKSTGSVRVIWVSSSAAELQSPNGGLDMSNLDYGSDKSTHHKYAVSKVGNILHCKEYAKRHQEDGIISVVSQLPCRLVGWRLTVPLASV